MSIEVITTPVIGLIIGWLAARVGTGKKEIRALKKGMQALLRDRLLQSYRYYVEKGYATAEERDNWENMYRQYHALGENGVMDNLREKLLDLPTVKKE